MTRRTAMVGLALVLAGAGGCTGGAQSTSAPKSGGAAAPTAVAGMVQRACAGTPPSAVTTAIPGATPSFTPSDQAGPTCSWFALNDTATRHVLALAVTSGTFDNWLRLYPGTSMTRHTSVAGYAAVQGPADDGCTVLVNVDGKALEVDLSGVPDPSCAATSRLAGQLVGSR